MAEEAIQEPVVETPPIPEPVIEVPTPPESTAEPQITEPAPTAQPVEPLNPEPIPEPEIISEPVLEPASVPEAVPEPEPAPTPEPIQVSQPQTTTPPVIQTSLARELLVKARETIQFRKRKKFEKIMGMFLKQSSITNDKVEKLLHVSDATATRYLKQLENEGKIRRQGSPEHMSYSRI